MFFRIHVFQGPDFLGSRFFRVQVFQGPGFLRSRFFRVRVPVLEKYFLANKSYLIDRRDRKLTNTQLSSSFAIRRNFRSKMKSYIKKYRCIGFLIRLIQQIITCSKLTMKTVEQGVEYVQN